MTLRPNRAFGGVRAGQFVRVGVEIDGVRRTRTYSPAGSEHARSRELELTVTEHAGGLVSPYLVRRARPGMVVHLSEGLGEFILPQPRPRRLHLISGGSGITPVLAMLRTLADEDAGGDCSFLHFARTEADWLYEYDVRALAQRCDGEISDHPRRGVRLGSTPTRWASGRRGDVGGRVRAAGARRRRPGGLE